MSDLISKRELYHKLGEVYSKGFLPWGANEIFKDIIGECQPVTIDEKRKKSEWILDETDNSVTCKTCGCSIYPNDILNGDPHFCPNCGADMRGE